METPKNDAKTQNELHQNCRNQSKVYSNEANNESRGKGFKPSKRTVLLAF